MSPNLELFVLAALQGSGALGITEELLLREARAQSWRQLTAPELTTQLRDLADRSLVAPMTPLAGPKRWRITTLGSSVLAEAGLA